MNIKTLTSTSGASSLNWTWEEVSLAKPWFKNKNLLFKVDLSGEAGSSTELDVAVLGGQRSGGTFAGFAMSSGTSVIITGGTTIGGEFNNGSYVVPLAMALHSGATEFFHMPYLKIGFRASKTTAYFEAAIF